MEANSGALEGSKCWMDLLPPEILSDYIFPCLNGVTFARCRRVCERWRDIFDGIPQERLDNTWRAMCEREYPQICREARGKAGPGVTWFHTYRNLVMWQHLHKARKTYSNLAVSESRRIEAVHVTVDGTIVLVHHDAIRFFDVRTLQPSADRTEIPGNYTNYKENKKVILIKEDRQLHVYKKILMSKETLEYQVFIFIDVISLSDNFLYYTSGVKLYKCDLSLNVLTPVMLIETPEKIMKMHVYNEKLYMQFFDGPLMKFENGHLMPMTQPFDTSIFDYMQSRYFIINDGDVLHSSPNKLYVHHGFHKEELYFTSLVTAVLLYNDILILGTKWGEVLFYKMKECNVLTKFDPKLPFLEYSYCARMENPIISIDVVECVSGHKLAIVTTLNVVIINYNHFE